MPGKQPHSSLPKKVSGYLTLEAVWASFAWRQLITDPAASYFGIEQREDLTEYAEAARKQLGLSNVSFIHGNITELDFSQYDHFYFYNSFYENIATAGKIDENIPYSVERYNQYRYFLYRQLEKKPSGTRVATFYGREEQMPRGYHVGGSDLDDLLKYWVKE